MNQSEFDENCSLCEHAQPLSGGDLCICLKKGVVPADGVCRAFCFDPLKLKVSAKKLPQFFPDRISMQS